MSTRPPRKPGVFAGGLLRRLTDERALDLKATVALYRDVLKKHQASCYSRPDAFDFIVREICARIEPPPPAALLRAFARATAELLKHETVIFEFPATDPAASVLSLHDQVELRRFLRAKEHFLARDDDVINMMAAALIDVLSRISVELPPLGGDTALSVPLQAMLTDPAALIDELIGTFARDEHRDVGLFIALQDQLYRNVCVVSRVNPEVETTKPLVFASEADLPKEELPAAYLQGTPLLELLTTPIPFAIPRATFAEHGAIFAPAGHGKTQMLQSIVLSFLNERDPPPMFIIDSMGAMLERIARLEVFNTTLKDRILILDPKDGPALNFFKLIGGSEAQQTELFFYLFKAIEQALTPRQATMVSYLVELMQVIDGANLHTLREVCETKQLQYTDALARLPQISQDFFRHQFMGQDALIKATKAQIAARLYTVGRSAVFNAMFSANENNFDAFDCIASKKIVLVSTDRVALGDAGSAIFGRFILAQCLAAALARASIPERERHLALIVVDEAKSYLDDQAEKILSDARQFGLGMLLATQAPHQLPESVQREVANNTSIKLLGPVPYATASQFARDMHATPEFIQSMKSRTHAEFACYVRNLTPRAVKLSIPIGALEAAPKMDDEAYKRLRERNRQTVTQKPTNAAPMRKAATNISAAPAAPQSLSPKPTQWDSDHGEVEG